MWYLLYENFEGFWIEFGKSKNKKFLEEWESKFPKNINTIVIGW